MSIVVPFCSCVTIAFADPPPGYYDIETGKTGSALQAALHDIIDDHTALPYSSTAFDTADALLVLDEDPANTNNVILIYSRRSEPKSTFGVMSSWTREHLWPNSYGLDDQLPAYSDLHNLRAADVNVNSSRGNEFYDWSDTNSPSFVLAAHPEAPFCSSDADSWEPPDEVKGDIARAVFYMAVRYSGDNANEPDLELTSQTEAVNTTNVLMGRLNTLLAWHQQDSPDSTEMLRNERVFELYQGNRNPFVDRPEWVNAVFVPRLTVELIADGVRLRWEVTGADMRLLSSTNLPPKWIPVTTPPAIDEQGWFVDVVPEVNGGFYRLILDSP